MTTPLTFDLGGKTAETVLSYEDARLIEGLRASEESSYERLISRFRATRLDNLAYRLLNYWVCLRCY